MPEPTDEEVARQFEELRPQLVGAAYRVLGSVADAEDAVQETWLRWAAIPDEGRSEVRDPRAYLLTAATGRPQPGPAAAEPARGLRGPVASRTGRHGPGAAESVEMADSVSMAMLVVLESLSPLSGRPSCSTTCSG